MMRVTFLGTGTSTGVPVPTCGCPVCTSDDPRDKRLRPSVRIEWSRTSLLIDTATDLRAQALRHGIRRIDAVLYTHAHADHILGLDELRLYNWRQRGPIPVYGSPRTIETLQRTFWYVFDDQPIESTKPAIEAHTIEQAIAEAERIGARRTVLTHLSHEVHHATLSARLPQDVDLTYDGLCLEVDEDGPGRLES